MKINDDIITELQSSKLKESTKLILQQSFKKFLQVVFYATEKKDFYLQDFHLEIINALELIVRGKLSTTNLIINMPPRFGKSTIVKYWLAWSYCINKDCNFLYTSYSDNLVLSFSDDIKKIIESDFISSIFKLSFSKSQDSKRIWQIANGGQTYAVSQGGAVTGFGAGAKTPFFSGALLIDDPIKPADAKSSVAREKCIDYFYETIDNRLNSPKTPVIIIMQRLHVEDLVGELEKNTDYTFIKCQGLLDDKTSAWSQTITGEKLLNIKKVRPDYFYAQYQQEPIIAGGNVIKKDYYNYYTEYPAKIKRLFVTADTAMKVKQHNDYSVFSVWGVTDTGLLWIDMVRGKWEAPELIEQAQKVYNKWSAFFDNCILSGFYIEDKASGTGLIQTLKRNTRIPVIAVPRAKDKVERLEGVLDYIASGNVCLPKFKTNMCDDIISESVAFKKDDSHTHDDIVDTLIDAVNIAEGRQQTTIPLSMYV
tara:strand:+ start:2790 stop:4229 length:1440 start_codon:yes stop_codon:yes gene_type:complete